MSILTVDPLALRFTRQVRTSPMTPVVLLTLPLLRSGRYERLWHPSFHGSQEDRTRAFLSRRHS